MSVSVEELRPHLQAFDFRRLFVEGLGWNHYQTEPMAVEVNEREYALRPVAEKAGFVVYECDSSVDDDIPPYPVRRKIESQVAKLAFEHLIVFVDPHRKVQLWQWVKRETGKPAACREIAFVEGQSGDHVLQRLQPLFVSLDEEPSLNISLVASRVRAALDVEKVTKRFYDRFRAELTAFGKFIDGISAQGDRDWYASLMLNRMMFVYFIQKQGFLDNDLDYLRNRLRMVRNMAGNGRFQQFYRIFLRRLFHEGLGQPESERSPDLAALLGKVPFLNGGLFDVHDLERDNLDISIPDEAFERVFEFFDGYRWHLDERPGQDDNEINPDVLGYIFEKYVNQKQMGAYYTKEDITGYISRNTVIPFLFDSARKECPVAFGQDGGVWRLLQDDPDRYIYPAVGHGVTWNAREAGNPTHLDTPFELPDEIAAGIGYVSQRGGWNLAAPDDYALPTETWREVVARRQRHTEVHGKLASGEVQEINDLITLNLDIELFAKDVIAQSEGPELLRAFWHAMRDVSILDPTCGSGAFLFAALNILEPLYTACLEGMRGFLDDAERSERTRSPRHLEDFRKVLDDADGHPSERYFILKSIVLNNLYGLDIMEEAVEICKLRLFLKLVAQLESYEQIEPLPDIDFNVRTGNTLVGFTSLDAVRQAMTITPDRQHRAMFEEDRAALARIEEQADEVTAASIQFRWQQTLFGGEVTAADKQALRRRLETLGGELDRHLATEYGVDINDTDAYETWRASHQPFHWFAEFHGIMSKGGFDVVIGNPPYVEYRTIKDSYSVRGLITEKSGNLYAMMMERSVSMVTYGHVGMIVPVSGACADGYAPLRGLLTAAGDIVVSHFNDRPSRLFEGLEHNRLSIFLLKVGSKTRRVFSTAYTKWQASERDTLFQRLAFVDATKVNSQGILAKMGHPAEVSILTKFHRAPVVAGISNKRLTRASIYYTRKLSYFVQILDFVPAIHDSAGNLREPSELKETGFTNELSRDGVLALLNSSLFYWLITMLSDCRNLNKREIAMARLNLDNKDGLKELARIAQALMADIRTNSRVQTINYKKMGTLEIQSTYPRLSKPIIDRIDTALAEHYGFTDEELDFIINYDIKYRMGRGG